MGNTETKESKSLRPHIKRTTNNKPGRSALLLGASGATGKFILSYLICSPEWSKITIIHRREINLDEISKQSNIPFTDQQKSKVTQHTLNMEQLCQNDDTITKNVELFKDHDITICTLGTTRSKADSAENFRKVDLYMVRDGGILSKKAGIKHFSLLTSKNANANLWANDWKISHGLLYLKTKGDAEQCIIAEIFMKTSIFRPSFLDRDATGNSSVKLSVRDLAAVMIYDAECDIETDKKKQDVIFYESGHINDMLVMSRNNYNDVCNGKQKDVNQIEDEKDDVDAMDNGDKGDVMEEVKKDVIEDMGKNKDEKMDVEQGNKSVEDVNEDDITPKYEVVEKPDGDVNGGNDEDYVEVDKDVGGNNDEQ